MPREIVNKNIAGVNTKCLSMTADQIGRTLRIGNQWNILHIGVLLGVDGGAAATITTPTFAMGICSGTSQMFGSFAGFTRNFFGVRTAGNITYNGIPAGYQSLAFTACRKVGNTVTDGSSTSARFGDATNNLLNLILVRLVKTGGNITTQVLTCTNSFSGQNRTFSEWLLSMECRTLTSLITNYTVSGVLSTLAYDEATNGTLDTLNIAWNSAAVPLVIKDFGVAVRR